MVELVLTVCLLAAPESCRQERPLLEPLSPMACVMEGQIHASRWVVEHPAWRLARWRCVRPGLREEAT